MPEPSSHVAKRERDKRSHNERILALREAFGELKTKAIQENKVNECSVTKVSKRAGVQKIYLTGKKFVEAGVAERYREIAQAILKFREEFQSGRVTTDTENNTKILEAELARVKATVYQYYLQLETSNIAAESVTRKLEDAENRIILLQAKLAEMGGSQAAGGARGNSERTLQERMVRTIISPDRHLIVNGQYQYHDKNLRNHSWLKSCDELEEALSRSYAKRLYILVGLPCSGKSTWAENAVLYPDRHPIIFDATNLTRFAREDLVHRFKRFKDVRKCCVYFDIPISIIRERNTKNRTIDRQLSDEEIDVKQSELQPPNPYEERWIEEMIVVRECD